MDRLVALEEHLNTPDIVAAQEAGGHGFAPPGSRLGELLLDLGEQRLADMDAQGVDLAVLSVTSPATQELDAAQAVPLAAAANDTVAAAVAAHPDRFAGFATLPTPDPHAAAAELRRCVTELGFQGAMVHARTGQRSLDHPDNEPVWAAAAQLRAPVYLHPMLPVDAVRQAYYSGIGPQADLMLAGPGIGWHYDVGLQLVRLIASGVFDRHPGLQVIVGHWGEVVLFYHERIAGLWRGGTLDVRRNLLDYLRENVSYTGSGMLSERYLRWSLEVVGAQRILYSTDYPYVDTSGGAARRFLETAELSTAQRDAIAHGNWEALTAHLR